MAESSISNYGDRYQVFGLGSSKFNTQALLEIELTALKGRSRPYLDQIAKYEEKQKNWNDLSASLTSLQSAVNAIRNMNTSEKSVTFTGTGATAVATSGAINGTYTIDVQKLASAHQIKSDTVGDPTAALGLAGDFNVNGKKVTITNTMTLRDIATAINQADAGAKAVLVGGTMVVTSSTEGAAGSISLTEGAGGILNSIGLLNGAAIKNEMVAAEDALYSVNGIAQTSSSNKIKNAITGIDLTLTSKTTTPMTMVVSDNTESILNNVKAFVASYNSLVVKITKLTGKGEGLQGEYNASNVINELNKVVQKALPGGKYLSQFGIELDGVRKDGSFKFNEAKFKEALNADSSAVQKAFSNIGGAGDILTKAIDKSIGSNGNITGTLKSITGILKKNQDMVDKYDQDFESKKEALIEKYAMYEVQLNQYEELMKMMETQFDAMNGKND